MNAIKRIWLAVTNPPSAKSLAAKELENAKRSYLEHKTCQGYYTALVSYDEQRISRLEKYLEEQK